LCDSKYFAWFAFDMFVFWFELVVLSLNAIIVVKFCPANVGYMEIKDD